MRGWSVLVPALTLQFAASISGTVSVFACALRTAPAAAAPSPASRPNGVGRLVGAWSCAGNAAGNISTETYSREAPGTVRLQNVVTTSSGARGMVSETFRFSPETGMWTVTAAPNQFFDGLNASGPDWGDGAPWMLVGTELFQKKAMRVRLVYTSAGSDAFRREHQVQVAGAWRDDAAYVCRRMGSVPTAAPLASGAPFVPALGQVAAAVASGATSRPGTVRATAATPWPFAPWEFGPRTALAGVSLPRVAATQQRVALGSSAGASVATERPATRERSAPARRISPATSVSRHPAGPTRPGQPVKRGMARRAIGSPARRARAGDNLALAPEPAGAQVFAGRPNDRAFSLVGTWTCRTATGQVSTQTYARTSGQELDMSNDLTVAGHRYRLDETYRFDPGAGRWENVQAGGAYRGSAAPWTGSSWTFHGVENEGRPSDVQMTYTALGDSAFRRVFARDQGGAWVPYLSETCHRG